MNDKRPLIEVKNLSKSFPIEKGLFQSAGAVPAVQDFSFSIFPGEIVALVGESGSGKTTLGKMVQGLLEPTSGEMLFDGKPAASLSRKERARFVQMIFQDPFASLNPKKSVGSMLEEAVSLTRAPLALSRKRAREHVQEKVKSLLSSVGLPADILNDYPHQFSGGQRQRLGIARALALEPRCLIADEPVSALDLSIQAQILDLMLDLNEKTGVSYLLITHDLSVVRSVADRVLVIHDGKLAEEGRVEELFAHAKDPYTLKLLSSALEVPPSPYPLPQAGEGSYGANP